MSRSPRSALLAAAAAGRPGRLTSLAAGVLTVMSLAALGAGLIRHGAQTVEADPAPLPTSTFDYATAPPALPGDPLPAQVSDASNGSDVGSDFAGSDRVMVPSLGIKATIVETSIANNALEIPDDVQMIARWSGGGSVVGETGTVLLAGHVDFAGQGAGAFHDLYRIQPGALIVVSDSTGAPTTWRVSGVQVVGKSDLDTTSLFAATGARQLKLVTCGGPLLHVGSGESGYTTYRDNVIVTALPV